MPFMITLMSAFSLDRKHGDYRNPILLVVHIHVVVYPFTLETCLRGSSSCCRSPEISAGMSGEDIFTGGTALMKSSDLRLPA